jgi:hypothetical protein
MVKQVESAGEDHSGFRRERVRVCVPYPGLFLLELCSLDLDSQLVLREIGSDACEKSPAVRVVGYPVHARCDSQLDGDSVLDQLFQYELEHC